MKTKHKILPFILLIAYRSVGDILLSNRGDCVWKKATSRLSSRVTRGGFISIICFLFILILSGLPAVSIAQKSNWTVYNTSNSDLPDSRVNAIAVDKDGSVWIGTQDGGLAKLSKDSTWTVWERQQEGVSEGPPSSLINSIAIDMKGNIWIGCGTLSGGLTKFDGSEWITYNMDNSKLPDNKVHSVAIDKKGVVWAGTGKGLIKYNPDGQLWTVYNSENSALPFDDVGPIAIDRSNNIWIGTFGGGLAKFDQEEEKGKEWTVYQHKKKKGLPDNSIWSLAIDKSGIVWIGTARAGLIKYNHEDWVIYGSWNSDIPSDGITSIAIDKNGTKWLGTLDGGLVRFNGKTWKVYNSSNSGFPDESESVITVITDDAGNKWVGTRGAGLAVFK